MGANPETPAALEMKEGININNRVKGKPFVPYEGNPQSTHGYNPAYRSMHTAFMVSGPGIFKNKIISGIELVDIAPLVSRLLGVDFEAPDGRLFPGIIDDE